MAAFVPFRAALRQPWFRLMARIGRRGADTYAPEWRLLARSAEGDLHETRLTARRSGPLYLFVNDAVVLLGLIDMHRNNHGTALVELELLARRFPGEVPGKAEDAP